MPKTKERSWIVTSVVAGIMAAAGVLLNLVRGKQHHQREPIEHEPKNPDVMYEARDANASVVGWVALGVIASAFLIHATVKLSYGYFSRAEFRSIQPVTMVSAQASPPHVPALQVNPAAELEQFRRSEEKTLSTYGWVDQQKGIVRIPIDEAMKKVVAQGLPSAEKSSSTATQPISETKAQQQNAQSTDHEAKRSVP